MGGGEGAFLRITTDDILVKHIKDGGKILITPKVVTDTATGYSEWEKGHYGGETWEAHIMFGETPSMGLG